MYLLIYLLTILKLLIMREFKNVSESLKQKIENCINTSVNYVNETLLCSYIVEDVKFLKTFVSFSLGITRSCEMYFTEIDFICSTISRYLKPFGLSCRFFGVDLNKLVIDLEIDL